MLNRNFIRVILLFFALLLNVYVLEAQENKLLYSNLQEHVYTLASDSMQGRATGSIGQKRAAQYIANNFAKWGMDTLAHNGYYQYYNLSRIRKNAALVKGDFNMLFWPWHYHFVSSYNHNDTINTRLVFVGAGEQELLSSMDLSDKAIALIADSPQEAYQQIKKIHKGYGNKNYFVSLSSKSKALDQAWSGYYQLSNFSLGEKFDEAYERRVLEEWTNLPKTDSLNIFYCFPNALESVLGYNDAGLKHMASKSDAFELMQLPKPEISLFIDYYDTVQVQAVENVVAMIPGKQSDETIVLSAHYDHLGVEFGQINYGADDNASGTAALLEIARILKEKANNGMQPQRNIVFIAFSGEEQGLLGSKHYVNNPLVPLSKTVLNINMDMLGRWDDKHADDKSFVYLLTAGENKNKVYKAGKKLNEVKGFNVTKKAGTKEKMVFKYGSDHYSFYEKKVPIAVIFTGLHKDYHTPYDTPEKINYPNLTNITRLVSNLAFFIANEPEKFPIQKKKE